MIQKFILIGAEGKIESDTKIHYVIYARIAVLFDSYFPV